MTDTSTMRVLKKAFSDLMPATLDGISVDLRPLSSEVPAVEKEWYDPQRRMLVILFKTASTVEKREIDSQTSLFFEPRTKQLSGFKLLNVDRRDVDRVSNNLSRTFTEYLSGLTRQIEHTPKAKVQERLHLLGRWDAERRRVAFFLNELPVAFTKERLDPPQVP